MTVTISTGGTIHDSRDDEPARIDRPLPPTRLVPVLLLLVFGAFLTAAGFGLKGSSWILPDGVLGGGVAIMLTALFVRTMLDVVVVSCPFLFYTLSPVGGILTAGTSDVLLPLFVLIAVAGFAVTRPGLRRPLWPLPEAGPVVLLAVLLMTATTAGWAIFSPEFLLTRAISDLFKLVLVIVYMCLVVVLARRGGRAVVVHAFRMWALTATGLSIGSLIGITGAVLVIPNDGFRSLGYFQDPNLYAGYLLVSISVVLFLASEKRSVWLPIMGFLLVGGIVTTGSRGAMLSLALLLAFSAVFINSARLRFLMLVGAGAVAAGAAYVLTHREAGIPVLGLDRLFEASTEVGEDPRLALWKLATSKFLENPITGIGPGQFERFSTDTFRSKINGLGYVTHNSFLYFAVAFGVVGIGLFLFLLWWIVRDLYRAPHLNTFAKHALMSGMLVITSQMMTLNLQNQRYVWIYFGLVLGLASLGREAPAPRPLLTHPLVRPDGVPGALPPASAVTPSTGPTLPTPVRGDDPTGLPGTHRA